MSEFVPEGWKVQVLDKNVEILSGFPFKSALFSDNKNNIGLIRIRDLTKQTLETSYNGDFNDEFVIKKGDVLIGMDGDFHIVKWRVKNALLNQRICKIKASIYSNFDTDFLFHSLQPELLSIHASTGATTVKHLSVKDIRGISRPYPPLPEQQKIAAILTSVDEVIEKTQAQINKLKDLKTGMMQELLTRGVGVDGKPHTEFKDSPVGRIPKAWEVVKLDNVATIQSGAAKSSKLTGDLIELPYLRVANVQDGYLNLAEIKTIMIPRNKSERFLLQNNDVLVNEGGDFDKLGRGSIWHSQITPCAHQNHVFVVRTDSKKLSPMFFNHLSGSEYGKKYYMGCAKQTTNLASINSTQLKQFPVLLPSLEEQDSICEVLDSVDQTIAKNQVKLAKNRNLKKALMQDLLTGKVRVKVDTE
jgi:type I restriction enzyme S subunit